MYGSLKIYDELTKNFYDKNIARASIYIVDKESV